VSPQPTTPTGAYPAGLTTREVEVLRLIAHGLTDAQVAERLIVSAHTVHAHLRSIYGKLDVTSRAIAKTEEEVADTLIAQLKARGHPDAPPPMATDGKGIAMR
jgi:DNA-binding CsgD family transcriptional regulator